MKYVSVVIVACLMAAAAGFIVTGRAEGHVPKTQVDLEFVVSFEDKSATNALAGALKQSDKLVKALKKFAGEDGVVASENNIDAVVGADGKVTGFKATIEVELDLNDQKDLAKAIEEGSKFGQLSDVEYEVDESAEEDLKTKLVADAYKDAEEKAKTYAKAIGVELGDLDTVEIDDLSDEEDDQDESSDTDVEVTLLYKLDDSDDEDTADDAAEKPVEVEEEEKPAEVEEPVVVEEEEVKEPEKPKKADKPKKVKTEKKK